MEKEEFKKVREDLGLSQQKMAEFIGIKDGRSIRRYEKGDWPIPQKTVDLLKEKGLI